MTTGRTAKKSETIEIRLSFEAKSAFMDRCRTEGRTASDVVRQLIDAQNTPGTRRPQWRVALAALLGAAIGIGVAAPSFATALRADTAAFEQLDRNHDQVLTRAEFLNR